MFPSLSSPAKNATTSSRCPLERSNGCGAVGPRTDRAAPPGLDGLGVCRHRRDRFNFRCVTARSAATDRALAREARVDDYVIKPFSVTDLVDRGTALIRRTEGGRGPLATTG